MSLRPVYIVATLYTDKPKESTAYASLQLAREGLRLVTDRPGANARLYSWNSVDGVQLIEASEFVADGIVRNIGYMSYEEKKSYLDRDRPNIAKLIDAVAEYGYENMVTIGFSQREISPAK